MALNRNKDLKMYYSIKEVADELAVTETTLRYWETVFPQVAPYKGANGVRRYTKDDIKTLRTSKITNRLYLVPVCNGNLTMICPDSLLQPCKSS